MHILIPALHRPTQPTGVCRHAAGLAQALAEQAAISKVTLLIGDWQEDYFPKAFNLTSDKIRLINIPINNTSLARNRWFLFGLPKVAKQLQPDVVHLSFPLPFIRRWFEAPVVATIHDLYPFEYPQNFGYPQVWFNQWFLRQCVSQSDGLSCVSNVTQCSLKEYFPKLRNAKPIEVIYNTVDFSAVVSIKPESLEILETQQYLLSVAQHRKNKNLDLLIQAFSYLLGRDSLSPQARLILVGSTGPESDNLEHLVQKLDLNDRVTFVSGLTDGELRWLYEHCAAFVIPSSTEGFCLPLVEAQRLGCPTVCSDIPILREVGSAQCHYFDLHDSPLKNLMSAIAAAITQPRPKDGFINPSFSKHAIGLDYLNFYNSLK